MQKISVIGAGQMGCGIAHVLALAGIEVTIIDADPASIERAGQIIERNLSRCSGENPSY